MASEAIYLRDEDEFSLVLAATAASGEVYQLSNGLAAVRTGLNSIAPGDTAGFTTEGQFTVLKTADIAFLDGGRVYWDHSANKAHYKKVNDRDFYIGRAVGDASASATTLVVNLNQDSIYDIDLVRDAALSVPTGTAAAGGFGYPVKLGGATQLELTATSEVQCIDLLSVEKFAVGAKGIAEFIVRPVVVGSTSAVDCNIGVANGTHASDFESVTEAVVFHIDGGASTINAQSRDGTTTVAVTDTTKTVTAGSAVANRTELWIDFRDNTDIHLYVDGVNVLPSSVFKMNAATGPLGIIFHLEKSTGTATSKWVVDAARVRLTQQA